MIAIKDVMKEVMMIVEAIEESDLFKGVGTEFLNKIGQIGEIRSFKCDSVICRANEKHVIFTNSLTVRSISC